MAVHAAPGVLPVVGWPLLAQIYERRLACNQCARRRRHVPPYAETGLVGDCKQGQKVLYYSRMLAYRRERKLSVLREQRRPAFLNLVRRLKRIVVPGSGSRIHAVQVIAMAGQIAAIRTGLGVAARYLYHRARDRKEVGWPVGAWQGHRAGTSKRRRAIGDQTLIGIRASRRQMRDMFNNFQF